MREVYRGNGFVVTTNDSGEIFVAAENRLSDSLRISALGGSRMALSYGNTNLVMIPTGHKLLHFGS